MVEQLLEEPGTLTQIANIPTAITTTHEENYHYWSDFRDATIFYFDGHKDFLDWHKDIWLLENQDQWGAILHGFEEQTKPRTPISYKHLEDDGFFCAAVHDGVASSIYWHNPHSGLTKDMGTTHQTPNRPYLETMLRGMDVRWAKKPQQKIIDPSEIIVKRPFILDFDLDAFCSHMELNDVDDDYEGIEGYTERIDRSIEILRNMPRPDLITITRSQLKPGRRHDYVPPDMVDEVQDYLIEKLGILYS